MLDGVEIFTKTTVGVRRVIVGTDGSIMEVAFGGNVNGTAGFSMNGAPDIFGVGNATTFIAYHQPVAGTGDQIEFLHTADVTAALTDMSTVPLPAGGLLLLSALGTGALLRRRKAA